MTWPRVVSLHEAIARLDLDGLELVGSAALQALDRQLAVHGGLAGELGEGTARSPDVHGEGGALGPWGA